MSPENLGLESVYFFSEGVFNGLNIRESWKISSNSLFLLFLLIGDMARVTVETLLKSVLIVDVDTVGSFVVFLLLWQNSSSSSSSLKSST